MVDHVVILCASALPLPPAVLPQMLVSALITTPPLVGDEPAEPVAIPAPFNGVDADRTIGATSSALAPGIPSSPAYSAVVARTRTAKEVDLVYVA